MARTELFPTPWAAARASRKPSQEEELLAAIQGASQASPVRPPLAAKNPEPGAAPMGSPRPRGAPAQLPTQSKAELLAMEEAAPVAPEGHQMMGLTLADFTGRPEDRGFEIDQKTAREFAIRRGLTQALNVDYTPEQLQQKYDLAMQMPSVQQQARGLDQMEDFLLAMPQRSAQVDLTPLMALTDAQTGSNFAASYKSPNNASQRKQVLDYWTKIQDDRRALHQSVMDAVKAQTMGKNTFQDLQNSQLVESLVTQLSQRSENQGKNQGTAPRPSIEANRFFKTFEDSKGYTEHQKSLLASDNIMVDLNDPHWIPDRMKIASLLSAAKLYPISNVDLGLFTMGPGIVHRAESAFNRAFNNQPLLPGDVAAIKDFTAEVRKKAAEKILSSAENYAQNLGKQYGYSKQEAMKLLEPVLGDARQALAEYQALKEANKKKAGQGASTGKGAPARTKALEEMTDAELEAYEKSLKGGK